MLIVVLAVVVLGGGATGAYLLLSGNSPTGVVNDYLTAIVKDKNKDEAKNYVCDAKKANVEALGNLDKIDTSSVTWTAPQEDSKSDSDAKVSTDLSGTLNGERGSAHIVYSLVKESGWKICDATVSSAGSGSSNSSGPSSTD